MRITRVKALTLIAATTVTVTGASSSPEPTEVENNVGALSVPTDFAEFSGYNPIVIDGHLANPAGDCSSPISLPTEFDSACKAHDLGYDLLRYAHFHSAELDPSARRSLDRELDRRMHEACDTRTTSASRLYCFALADIATTAVNGNSWRQGYLTPVRESGLGYGVAGLVAMTTLGFGLRRRRAA